MALPFNKVYSQYLRGYRAEMENVVYEESNRIKLGKNEMGGKEMKEMAIFFFSFLSLQTPDPIYNIRKMRRSGSFRKIL